MNPETSALRWLLDSDLSVRWQAMRDLAAKPVDMLRRQELTGGNADLVR